MNDSVIIYRSFVEASKMLPPDAFKECWTRIFDYALDDIEPDEIANSMAEIIFTMAQPQIDANKKRKADGLKGGRGKKKPMVSEIKTYGLENEKPMVSEIKNHRLENEKPNVNVNDNVNVNVNVNDNYLLPENSTEITLPLKNKKEHKLTKSDIEELEKKYPRLNVRAELKRMVAWCKDNPEKLKTECYIGKFIERWLDNENTPQEERPPGFMKHQQREYNFSELEKEVRAN